MTLNPLSTMLKRRKIGYELRDSRQRISHFIYMDDIKIMCKMKEEIEHLLRQGEIFTKDTRHENLVSRNAELLEALRENRGNKMSVV